jgi:hypothetical protein
MDILKSFLVKDFGIGLILLFTLVVFYEITLKVFYPALHFYENIIKPLLNSTTRMAFCDTIHNNPGFLGGYFISFFVQILMSASCILLRNRIVPDVTLLDVMLICTTPSFVLFVMCAPLYIKEAIDREETSIFYLTYIGQDIIVFASNTIVLGSGGILGFAVIKFFIDSLTEVKP